MERETGLEPATIYMASRCSTTELLPRDWIVKVWWAGRDLNPHGSHHQILNLARLPFRHPPPLDCGLAIWDCGSIPTGTQSEICNPKSEIGWVVPGLEPVAR